jgi:hypothetical protein
MPMPRNDPITTFWKHVVKTPTCWLWDGRIGRYGKFMAARTEIAAHRFSYEIHHGPIPPGVLVRHSCDVRSCVNPDHLLLGTHALNANDRKVRGRNNTPRGETSYLSRLTARQVLEIRSRYAAGSIFQYELAAEYGVTQPNIQAIVARRSWTHL